VLIYRAYRVEFQMREVKKGDSNMNKILSVFLVSFVFSGLVYAEQPRNSSIQIVNIDVLADAIYKAEGGAKTRHPYGILKKYKKTTPRQACINTIKSNLKRYRASRSNEDFISFMSRSYCPIGAKNDPTGLNRHWVKNVSYFYAKGLSDARL
jgi:hypothetical protein